MATLIPQLRFNDDKCREALEFYKQCFGGGETTIMSLGDSPMAAESPKEMHGKVMHSTFKHGGISFICSDMMRDKAVIGDNVSMMVECDSEEHIRSLFDKLSQGGDVFMPVEPAFWGSLFAVVTDKYGIEWNLNYTLKK